MKTLHAELDRLVKIMDDLRMQCPWDKVQTMQSLRHLTLEEVYELSEAVLQKNHQDLEGELGDVLLHIIFYCKIADEDHHFNLTSVISRLCEKLIRRHPHIYGNVKVANADDVKANWEALKLKETASTPKGLLSGVPKAMPSLLKAYRMQEKASAVGFDWPNTSEAWLKVFEDLKEFKHELQHGTIQQKTEEFGDLLFSLINVARHTGINPEDALAFTNNKFKKRIEYMEDTLHKEHKKLHDASLSRLEELWEQAKSSE
ncbi:MAG: nucleoside triphosphate pyrophosphohydrolase [Bacteroidia bacterium]